VNLRGKGAAEEKRPDLCLADKGYKSRFFLRDKS
jgi:hypothetical protein